MKNVNESGRSMVEMLGVLAIIGVLSIGGILGYTRAMNNWKANEILDAANRVMVAAQLDQTNGQTVTYQDLGGSYAKLAGAVVTNITAYGPNASSNAGSVSITLLSSATGVQTAIYEKLNCVPASGATTTSCFMIPPKGTATTGEYPVTVSCTGTAASTTTGTTTTTPTTPTTGG